MTNSPRVLRPIDSGQVEYELDPLKLRRQIGKFVGGVKAHDFDVPALGETLAQVAADEALRTRNQYLQLVNPPERRVRLARPSA